jgi:hypothetical protein
MSWAVGYDERWGRWIGYGVPAYCDHPKCNAEIDRGLCYVCAFSEPHGGEKGCGLYFCYDHGAENQCPRCANYKSPYKHPKPEHPKWIRHLLTAPSWAEWRKTDDGKEFIKQYRKPRKHQP